MANKSRWFWWDYEKLVKEVGAGPAGSILIECGRLPPQIKRSFGFEDWYAILLSSPAAGEGYIDTLDRERDAYNLALEGMVNHAETPKEYVTVARYFLPGSEDRGWYLAKAFMVAKASCGEILEMFPEEDREAVAEMFREVGALV